MAQNRHFAPPTAESPIAQRRLRWPNPQSRSAGCDGLTIWSDQSKAHSNPHPKTPHTNHSRNQWTGSPESCNPCPAPIGEHTKWDDSFNPHDRTAPPMGATAPRIPFLSAQTCNAAPQIRSPPHRSNPEPPQHHRNYSGNRGTGEQERRGGANRARIGETSDL